jgi:nucleotide-binding universal stress UspA family protein
MTYKTILVHVDSSQHAVERIRIAAELALAYGAHLIGAALMDVVPSTYYIGGGFDIADPSFPARLEAARKTAEESLQVFEVQAGRIGVASIERRLADNAAWDDFTLQARYSDLLVIGQSIAGTGLPASVGVFAEQIVLNSPRPVLIVPAAGHAAPVGKRVLIAWNASMEAARAVAGAIPLLRHAQQVDVLVFNPEREPYDAHGPEAGADIALFLSRHGIRVEVKCRTVASSIGDALMSAAADLSSEPVNFLISTHEMVR